MDDRWIDPNEDRLTPEREAEIRRYPGPRVAEVLRELDAVRAESEGRRQVLLGKSADLAAEWRRAENAEARAERLAAMLQRHHEWHQNREPQQVEDYLESDLCECTCDALGGQAALAASPAREDVG